MEKKNSRFIFSEEDFNLHYSSSDELDDNKNCIDEFKGKICKDKVEHLKTLNCTATGGRVENIVKREFENQNTKISEYIQNYCLRLKEFVNKKYHKCDSCKEPVGYRCKVCNRIFASYNSAYSHVRNSCTTKPHFYKCANCSHKSKLKGNLKAHLLKKHAMKQCPECQQEFTGNRELKIHRFSECKKLLQFKCGLCLFRCNLNIQLNNHIKNFHKAI